MAPKSNHLGVVYWPLLDPHHVYFSSYQCHVVHGLDPAKNALTTSLNSNHVITRRSHDDSAAVFLSLAQTLKHVVRLGHSTLTGEYGLNPY